MSDKYNTMVSLQNAHKNLAWHHIIIQHRRGRGSQGSLASQSSLSVLQASERRYLKESGWQPRLTLELSSNFDTEEHEHAYIHMHVANTNMCTKVYGLN